MLLLPKRKRLKKYSDKRLANFKFQSNQGFDSQPMNYKVYNKSIYISLEVQVK